MNLFDYNDRPLERMNEGLRAIRRGETAEELRRKVLNGFRPVEQDHPLLTAVRVLIENAREEATAIATDPSVVESHARTAHAAGGAYWLELLEQRVKDAWDEAHKKVIDRQ